MPVSRLPIQPALEIATQCPGPKDSELQILRIMTSGAVTAFKSKSPAQLSTPPQMASETERTKEKVVCVV